jgi:hypothetical protein
LGCKSESRAAKQATEGKRTSRETAAYLRSYEVAKNLPQRLTPLSIRIVRAIGSAQYLACVQIWGSPPTPTTEALLSAERPQNKEHDDRQIHFAMRALSDFAKRRRVTIPPWTQEIQLVCNAIDGYPPFSDQVFSVEAFVQKAPALQLQSGGGEWDVLVYAIEQPGKPYYTVQPYGPDNSYRRLRSGPGNKVKVIARFDYMCWVFFHFEPPGDSQVVEDATAR